MKKIIGYLKNLVNVLDYGKTQNKHTLFQLRKNKFSDIKNPIFILSTGRCGTAWLTELFEKDENYKVIHHENPVMRTQGKLAYKLSSNYSNLSNSELELFQEIYLTGREEVFLKTLRAGKKIVFTDSRATFFAYVIKDLFPSAKFIHLYRHPGQVVRSAIRRSWYNQEHTDELSRIIPLKDSKDYNEWVNYDLIEKNSWLWNETNQFIENFFEDLNSEQKFSLDFNTWSEASLFKLTKSLGLKISKNEISKHFNKVVNSQKSGNLNKYKDWEDSDKNKLKKFCSNLSAKYGYEI